MSIHCPVCDTENPDGGRFCIECGAPLREAAVGSTERLPDSPSGKQCSACGVKNPPNASFCVNCGRALEAGVEAPRPVATAARPVVSMPAEPAPLAPTQESRRSRHHGGHTRPHAAMWGGAGGGIFLIGLAVLFVTGWWWPGILVLIGLMSLLSGPMGGNSRSGIIGACWMIGLAILFTTGWWWPGILVLIGATAIANAVVGQQRWRS